MQVTLQEDKDATRALGESVMDFRVRFDDGEQVNAHTQATVDALAYQAALAWDAFGAWKWTGAVQ